MKNYAAGIVLYNPNIQRLKKNLDAICPQVERVYCYNNGFKRIEEIFTLLANYENLVLLGEGTNVGIAKALNVIVDEAEKDDIQWILTLDQDSVVCDKMVSALEMLTIQEKAAIICPIIEDIRRKNERPANVRNSFSDIGFCITSGSFMNIKILKEIGGFDEFLFVGLVDNEICYRLKINGYRIIRNNAVVLNHELGNLTPSKHEKMFLKIGEILRSETIKKLSYKREVTPLRLYYATRNMLYMKKKYIRYIEKSYWDKRIIKNSLSSVIRGKQKWNLIKAIYKGILDGKSICVDPYVCKSE